MASMATFAVSKAAARIPDATSMRPSAVFCAEITTVPR